VHRHAVDVHGAGAAVAGVTAFLDGEMAMLTQERAQALARAGLGPDPGSIDAHQ
jgi:hypothetical protein